MLEFIVLGNIPGTTYIVTFNWVLSAAAACIVFGLLQYREHRLILAAQAAAEAEAARKAMRTARRTRKNNSLKSKRKTTRKKRA